MSGLSAGENPVILLGDIKCDTNDCQIIRDWLEVDSWVDLGHNAHIWGQERDEATCLAPGASVATRRDFVFTNPEAFPLVTNFRVLHQSIYPVHSILQFTLRSQNITKRITKANTPLSMHKTFIKHFDDNHPAAADNDEARKARHEAWKVYLNRFHSVMKECFRAQTANLQSLLDKGDTNSLWIKWNNIIEDAFCSFCDIDESSQKHHRGHGIFRTKTHSIKASANINKAEGTLEESSCSIDLRRVRAQSRRLTQWAANLHALRKGQLKTKHAATIRELNAGIVKGIIKHSNTESDVEASFLTSIHAYSHVNPLHVVAIRMQASRMDRIAEPLNREASKEGTKARANIYKNDPHHTMAYRNLGAKFTSPIIFLSSIIFLSLILPTEYR